MVDLDGDGVLDTVGVLQGELEELSSAQHGMHGAGGGDGLAEHPRDALTLGVLPVGGHELQVAGTLLLPALPGWGPRGP